MKNGRLGLYLSLLFAVSPLIVYINREVTLETLTCLFISMMFLFVVKYLKNEKWYHFLAISLFFGLSCITKEIAMVLLLPLSVLIFCRNIHLKPYFIPGLLLFLVITAPIYYLMSLSDFLSFHNTQITGESVYTVGEHAFISTRFTSILTFIAWINIGLIPVIIVTVQEVKDKGKKIFINLNQVHLFIIFWLVAGIIFSLSITLMGAHYDYYLFIPFVIILGCLLFKLKEKKWAFIIVIIYLVTSLCGVGYLYQLRGPNMAVEYLKENISENDTILVSDLPIFRYYFPNNNVTGVCREKIVTSNASYIILKATDKNRYFENSSIETKMLEYEGVFETKVVEWDVKYYIYKKIR